MRKISYSAAPPGEEAEITGPSIDLVEKTNSAEAGGRGFVDPAGMTGEFDATDPSEPNSQQENKLDKSTPDGLTDLLILLGDEMDKESEESLANFADFLIKKFADAKSANYTELFNALMIKINNADIVNTNEILKKLAKIYSRTLILEYMKNEDLDGSKESAYKKTLHRADQYLSEV